MVEDFDGEVGRSPVAAVEWLRRHAFLRVERYPRSSHRVRIARQDHTDARQHLAQPASLHELVHEEQDPRGDDSRERIRPRIADHSPADQLVGECVVVWKLRVLLDGEEPILSTGVPAHATRGPV
jgi:hypothetical protein